MVEYQLRNGKKCLIEAAKVEDAAELVNYANQVAGESDNLTFGAGEFDMTVEAEAGYIASMQDDPNILFLVARIDGKIVANVHLHGGARGRVKHSAAFGISVLKEYWGMGIGRLMLEEMVDWAKTHGFTKLNLKVRSGNEAAISLYRKLGFTEEGIESRGMRINGQYVDFILMGLILD